MNLNDGNEEGCIQWGRWRNLCLMGVGWFGAGKGYNVVRMVNLVQRWTGGTWSNWSAWSTLAVTWSASDAWSRSPLQGLPHPPQTLPRPIGGPISTHLISRCEGVEMWMGLGSVAWSGQSGWTQSCGRTCKLANLNSFFKIIFGRFFSWYFFYLFSKLPEPEWVNSIVRTHMQ